MINIKKSITIIFIILTIIFTGGFYIYKTLQPSQEVITFSDELYLIIEDIVIENGTPVVYEEGILYFSFDILKEFIDENLFYDEEEKLIIFTNKEKIKRYLINEKEASVNSKPIFINNVIKKVNDKVYIPIDLVYEDYDVDINYYEETNAVVIDYKDMYYLTGDIIQVDAAIRTDLDIKAPILEGKLEVGKVVYIYGEFENWYKVRTIEGIPGFIEKKYIKVNHIKDIYKTELKNKVEEYSESSNKINLTWDYTYGKVKNADKIVPIPGVNTISPTWFSIIDDNGKIYDKGSIEYVAKYKKLGYDIWPMFDNNFDPDQTHEILKLSSKREEIINELLKIYMDYGFSGINIDFENVYLKDKDLLTQFVRELYPLFKANDMTVSMDVTGLSTSENWSLSFDRSRLTDTTDYLVLMAYDQHWASSPIAGSVAEYSWVETSLKKIFDLIPREKLILAVPFYTRVWTLEGDKISSQAISMEVANKFIENNKMELIWDENAGQYFGEINKENKLMKIWLEDTKSLEYKASLIHKYDLAGIASWRKGFETPDIWTSLSCVFE